jgi:hypothetical protein
LYIILTNLLSGLTGVNQTAGGYYFIDEPVPKPCDTVLTIGLVAGSNSNLGKSGTISLSADGIEFFGSMCVAGKLWDINEDEYGCSCKRQRRRYPSVFPVTQKASDTINAPTIRGGGALSLVSQHHCNCE